MRRLNLLVVGFCFSFFLNAQTVDKPYEVATWKGFTQTAITYTFDDGCANQFAKARPMFDKAGFPMTLFTVINWSPNWTVLKEMAAKGHEVASHTVKHSNFGEITVENQIAELKDSKTAIDKQITGMTWMTHAYPYCVKAEDTIVNKYYISARGCQGFIEPKTPGNYMNVSSVIVGNQGAIKTEADFKTNFESAAKKNGWLVMLIHGIDDDGGYSPIPSADLQKSIDYLSARKPKFWVTTFGNATRYAKERNAVVVKETSSTADEKTLSVTDNLTDSIYNLPLSLRCPLSANWPSASVSQNNIAVSSRIIKVDTVVYVTFDVVPDAGEVKLSKNNTAVTPEVDTIPSDNPVVKPSGAQAFNNDSELKASVKNQMLFVFLPQSIDTNIIVNLYDLKGISLISKSVMGCSENKELSFSLQNIKSGFYIVRVSDGKNLWTRKISV